LEPPLAYLPAGHRYYSDDVELRTVGKVVVEIQRLKNLSIYIDK